METTGYVLRLCPFESLAFSGVTLTDDDLDAFIEVKIHFESIEIGIIVISRECFAPIRVQVEPQT